MQLTFLELLMLILVVVNNVQTQHTCDQLFINKKVTRTSEVYEKWPLLPLTNVSSVNLYKQFLEYIGAVLNEGIPALQINPIDPINLNRMFVIENLYDPGYTNYTNMTIRVNGMNVSGFSEFEVVYADTNGTDMSANMSLSLSEMSVTSNNIVATATDFDGNSVWYKCSNVVGCISDNRFMSHKKLQVNRTFLQVEIFDLSFDSNTLLLVIDPAECLGHSELQDYMGDLLLETLGNVVFDDWPRRLDELSATITTILNDIFILRNITDVSDAISQKFMSSPLSLNEV